MSCLDPEDWWELDAVQQLLGNMLEKPDADYSQAVDAALDAYGGALLDVHVHGLVRALEKFVGGKIKRYTISRTVALHVWLFHLGGGVRAKLLPAPAASSGDAAAASRNQEKAATKASAAFFSRRRRLKDQVRAGSPSASAELAAMRARSFDFKLLRLCGGHQQRGQRASSSGGPHPPEGSDAERERRFACLLAFAMGTHERLGEGYASRDGPCAVRRLAGNGDVLGYIADFVLDKPRRTLVPPPREVEVLRTALWQEHKEKLAWRELAEHTQAESHAVTVEAERAARRERQAHVESAAERERCKQRLAEMECEGERRLAAMERECERRLKEQRLKHAQQTRERALEASTMLGRERTLREVAEQSAVRKAQDADKIAREQSAEQMERIKAACQAADQHATSLGLQAAEQQAALERLRNARNGTALERQRALEHELRESKRRRTLNQRRVSDANLADRRARAAEERAAEAQARLGEFAIEDEEVLSRAERADAREKQVTELEAKLKEATALAEQCRAIAEPPRSKFYNNGFTPLVDLCACEVMLLGGGVARNQVPELFTIFANFYGVKIPLRKEEMKVPAGKVDGKMTYKTKPMPCLPSKTHCKRLLPVLNQLHKLQVGKELLSGGLNAHFCYGSDGAESLQRDFVLHQLTRRVDGKLQTMSVDIQQMHGKTAEAQAENFIASLREIAELCKRAGITEDISPLITNPSVTSSINDRAAAARKAARLVLAKLLGVDVETVPDGPSCAEHAWVNILEEGRKAIDGVLREIMNITEDQAESDAKKVKAMRTAVGWFSSPACATIYQVCKYVAAFSSKGYAVGEKFAQWLAAELHVKEDSLEGELLGHVQDLIAICGSRSYVFFMNAAVVERLCSVGSLLTFLEEEADLGSESGGKLRSAILTGFNSQEIMAAVRAMALICDSCIFTGLRSIKPEDTAHILDVLPFFWPKALGFFEEAAQSPATVVSGELCLLPTETARQRKDTPRAARAEVDMHRIRAAAKDDALVERMLTAAFKAMAAGTRNHASEFLPGGRLCSEAVTPELRAAFDGCQTTSTSVERGFAIGRLHDRQAGVARADSRAGWMLGKMDGTVADLRSEPQPQQVAFFRLAKKRARETYTDGKLAAVKLAAGLAKSDERSAKLSSKRAKKIAKEKERARIADVTLVERFTGLVQLRNDELQDQLKAWKLKLGKESGFAVSYPNRKAYVLQLQTIMAVQFGSAANDLPPGESGIVGRGLKVRRTEKGPKGAPKKRKAGVQYYGDYEWDEEANEAGFAVEAIVDKVKADGTRLFANQGKARKGRILYRIIFEGHPADLEWWEPASQIDPEMLLEYEAGLAAQVAAQEADAAEDAELEESDDDDV